MRIERRRGSLSSIVLTAALLGLLVGGAAEARAACPTEGWVEVVSAVGARDGTDGIGGSGLSQTGDDGIGGSGRGSEGGDEDGIGGSGVVADSGFFGTVTGFGSLCVNGARVEYDADVPVRVDDMASSAAALRVGQVVSVAAQTAKARGLVATEIEVVHAVVGPVTAVGPADAAGRRHIEVTGALVFVETPGVAVVPIGIGARVAVSGLRDEEGAIVASRIDAPGSGVADGVREARPARFATTADRVEVEGYVVRGADRRLRVSGILIEERDRVAAGERVRIRAARRPGETLRPTRIERLRPRPLLRGLDRDLRPPPLPPRPPRPGAGRPGSRSHGREPAGASRQSAKEVKPDVPKRPTGGARAAPPPRPPLPPRPPPIIDGGRPPKRPPSRDVRPPPPPPPGM